MQCTAKSKTHAGQCRAHAVKGKTKCRMHGGAKGSGRPVVHGKYSKNLPTRLAARYDEALKDKDLTTVRHEISLAEALLCETLEGIHPESEAEIWKSAVDKYKRLKDVETGDPAVVVNGRALASLADILNNGLGEAKKKADAIHLMETKRKLAETEAKRIQSLQMTMTVEQAGALASNIVRVVRECVSDPRERERLGVALGELYGSRR